MLLFDYFFIQIIAQCLRLHYHMQLNLTFALKHSQKQGELSFTISDAADHTKVQKAGKVEHHLWKKRESAGSGQKAMNLVRIISGLPNEKESVYGALDKWIAWETEFPLIATAKALRILRQRRLWKRVIQVRCMGTLFIIFSMGSLFECILP
ncbi:pentatricopeptide repeat-containing protein At4g18975, chloroplastic [Capsicum annuum]|uniref:pentatricopeptide repeat-containing protein At4g18975, chloroplastic n=1 Tax=Capsicum annuum TaxID=4072 RepID=UPI001FB0A9C9|nr:pentatricopeptide repeat-containing protein At4g18975, chloroplastic [Capsicum annuum]